LETDSDELSGSESDSISEAENPEDETQKGSFENEVSDNPIEKDHCLQESLG